MVTRLSLSPNKAPKGNSVWALFCEPAVMILFMINTTLILLVKAKDQRSEMALFMTTEVLSVTVDRSTPPDPPPSSVLTNQILGGRK